MDVRIEQVTSTVESLDPSALLTPAVLARIVHAVMAAQEADRSARRRRDAELDMRPVVEQQRDWRR